MERSLAPRTAAILSLSLLTVMAGAAVAPALGVIKAYFSSSDPVLVQMIISMPALFIVLTNAVFPALCRRFRARTLVLLGLLLYTVGGCAAGAFSAILPVLLMRALVGMGVGIIMPLSTGLLSFYYPPEKLDGLMAEFPQLITAHRGLGLIRGLELSAACPVGTVANRALEKGLLIISAGNNVLRFVPPLIITKEDTDEAVEILRGVFSEQALVKPEENL